eukprot:CAMPEP_0114007570 /NCGR_PEP_ID=MMETSP0372-20130328/4954_1 /TAXON_ID=340204 /ORGANISM="Lankesteria abbotti" /LENGTH=47 /assembly_acc=CAM_ASM_000359
MDLLTKLEKRKFALGNKISRDFTIRAAIDQKSLIDDTTDDDNPKSAE